MSPNFRTLCIAMALAVAPAAAVQAQVSVDVNIGVPGAQIGVYTPAYPELAQVPGYPVYYAPQLNANYFFYDGLYWVLVDDRWYASPWYNGPWQWVAPEVVPVYVLRVPVRYYRQPPVYFNGWFMDAPPRWGDHWGPNWARHRHGWDRWDPRHAPRPAPLPAYQQYYRGDRYPGSIEQQRAIRAEHDRYRPHDPVNRQIIGQPAVPIRVEPPPHGQRGDGRDDHRGDGRWQGRPDGQGGGRWDGRGDGRVDRRGDGRAEGVLPRPLVSAPAPAPAQGAAILPPPRIPNAVPPAPLRVQPAPVVQAQPQPQPPPPQRVQPPPRPPQQQQAQLQQPPPQQPHAQRPHRVQPQTQPQSQPSAQPAVAQAGQPNEPRGQGREHRGRQGDDRGNDRRP